MDLFRVAWLAGVLDGEGSVGISRGSAGRRGMSALVQMSTTCPVTMRAVREVLAEIGMTALGYSYEERDPSKHQDAHYLRVNRLNDIKRLCEVMIPFSVTKRPQWLVMLEFTSSRLQGTTIDAQGRIVRGGNPKWWRPYTEMELECYDRLRILNLRGSQAVQRRSRQPD